jgi:hypothetical protein
MTSEVDIANAALDKLGAETIDSLTSNNENARIINRRYRLVLNAMLRAHTWNCAKKRVVLAPLSDEPAFDYDYQFQLPADCLRPIFPSATTDWKVEGKKILTNDGAVLNLPYISTLEDPNDMDACFVETFAARLAYEIAEKVTQSATKRKLAAEAYKEAMAEAKKANAFESIPQAQDYSSWVDARRIGPNAQDPMKVQRNN